MAQRAEPSDGTLVQQTLDGDRSAFDVLVRRHQRQAFAVSYRLLNNTHDAMEVTQDAMLKAFAGLDKLAKPEAFAGWLMRIVSNLSLNFRRSRSLRRGTPLDDLVEPTPSGPPEVSGTSDFAAGTDPLKALAGKELGDKLAEALQKLPEKQRSALVMFTMEKMPQKDVAEALECSVEAVKWHVFQGRKRLREMLKEVM